ncbi:hypothetical protein LCGC14_2478750, partial [marine sediment metagenome]
MREVKLNGRIKFDVSANGHVLPGELKAMLGIRGYEKWLSLDGQKAKVTALREHERYDIRFECGYTIEEISISHFFGYVDRPEPIATAGGTHDELDKVDEELSAELNEDTESAELSDSINAVRDKIEAEDAAAHDEEVFDSAVVGATDETNDDVHHTPIAKSEVPSQAELDSSIADAQCQAPEAPEDTQVTEGTAT